MSNFRRPDDDTKNSTVAVWLAKFPKYITEKILESSTDLAIGTLEYKGDKKGKQVVTLQLSPGLLSAGLPSQHEITFTDLHKSMYIVKTDPKSSRIEGTISKECFVRPVINMEYINFKREKEKNIAKRGIQLITLKEGKITDKHGDVKDLENLARKRKKMLVDKKRERLDKKEVMDIIFNAFESNESWTVKDLADFCGQPMAYIQEIIPEICIMNKKDHRNTWELKPEYK